jgi:hypothetical protein
MSNDDHKPPREPAPAILWAMLGALAVIVFLLALKLMGGGTGL